jgi:hypothetical protein
VLAITAWKCFFLYKFKIHFFHSQEGIFIVEACSNHTLVYASIINISMSNLKLLLEVDGSFFLLEKCFHLTPSELLAGEICDIF